MFMSPKWLYFHLVNVVRVTKVICWELSRYIKVLAIRVLFMNGYSVSVPISGVLFW